MKRDRIIFWITTSIIFLWESAMPAFTSNTQIAIDGIRSLGYPDYFRVWLTIFKVAGGLILILPVFKGRIKEWAYAGFTFDFLFAFISHAAVNGFNPLSFFPLIVLAILGLSYIFYHRAYGVHAKTVVPSRKAQTNIALA
ncbi:DoxX family protein [Pollutibacter soli]|uniref:DoxX family protein n=1 Tax=Pollutibacter soli TaxID=3034157 RepID=UPI0030134382